MNLNGVNIELGVEFLVKVTVVPRSALSGGKELQASGFISLNELPTKERVDNAVNQVLEMARQQFGEEYRLKTKLDLSRQAGVVLPIPDWPMNEPITVEIVTDADEESLDETKIGGTSSDDEVETPQGE